MHWLAVLMLGHVIVASKALYSRSRKPVLLSRVISKYRTGPGDRFGTHFLLFTIVLIYTYLFTDLFIPLAQQYHRQLSLGASGSEPILSDITLDFLHPTNNNDTNNLNLSHLQVPNSRITPYWMDQLSKIDRNIAKNLISQLIPDNPLGMKLLHAIPSFLTYSFAS